MELLVVVEVKLMQVFMDGIIGTGITAKSFCNTRNLF